MSTEPTGPSESAAYRVRRVFEAEGPVPVVAGGVMVGEIPVGAMVP